MMLILLFAIISYSLESCIDGYYYDGTQCSQCDDSCFTCTDGISCTGCTAFMYLNSTTGLCQYCQSGWYYDDTSQACNDCQGICTGACFYQTICFQCSSGTIYDTDLLKCVDICDAPKVLHNDTQFLINPICRSTNIYIDSKSSSIIELGTVEYPYKDSESAFSEIFNQYSHSTINISIFIKENSELKMTKDMAYFINITSVTISSYSESSSQPNSAFLLIEDSIQSRTNKTLFRILSYSTIYLNNILSKGNFLVNEVVSITQEDIVLNVLRTNLNISNILVSSISTLDYVFINFISAEIKQILINNSYFNISGHILRVLYPVNAKIQNVQIDASRIENGFMFDISCNYPEASLENEVSFYNISAFYAQQKETYEWPEIIYYQGPGNITAKYLKFSDYYSSYEDYKSTIFVTTSQACQPNDNQIQLFNFDEASFSLKDYPFHIPLFNGIEMSLQFSIYRK